MKFKCATWVIILALFIPASVFSQTSKPLIVYTGMTMVKPMSELANEFEKTNKCKIRLIKGATGNLLDMILKNKNEDLFLPGSESYIQKMEVDYPGLIIAKAQVGSNKAALFVKKGNPKNIPNELDALSNEKYRVIIGSAQNGSIGKETKKILMKHGSYDGVAKRAKVTGHVMGLVNALKMDRADISINWFAASTWPENKNDVEAMEIREAYSPKKKLILTVLKDSNQQELAISFLEFVSSEHGKSVFQKYGLGE